MSRKIPLSEAEHRPFRVIGGVSEYSTSYIKFICPFCGETVKAYLWSFAGCGKRCPKCKAIANYILQESCRDILPSEPKRKRKGGAA